MRTVVQEADELAGEHRIERLPVHILESLGELAGAAKEGLLALSVGVGLGVLHELMEAEVDEVVGPKGKHLPDRTAVRHGHEGGEVTLGGRRVPVSRPRARSADGSEEVELRSYAHFAARDQLADVMLERMLVGVSTRRYARTGEPVGADIDRAARSTSKSAVSREFVSRTREHLIELMSRPLEDLRLAVLMLDGIELKGRCCIVALGIDVEGVKHPLGLWDGSTENATVATTLLANLVERGLDVEQGVLVVLDGAKALRKAVRDVFGTDTPVQRCVRHKECHGAATSGAAIRLEDDAVFKRSRDAAIRRARPGHPAGAMVRGHAGGGGRRRGLDRGRRGRPGDARRATGRRLRVGVPGDDERGGVGPRASDRRRLGRADRRCPQGQGRRFACGQDRQA